jgi:hypothetical protein
MTAQDVVTRAGYLLNDSGNANAVVAANTRWTTDELLLWITDAQREVVVMTPNASAVVEAMPLVAGTRQTIPAEGWVLLSVKRNLTASGTPGRSIRQVSQSLLDSYDPEWHTDTPSPTVWNYTFDMEDRKAFYVYPPNDGTGAVELNYAATPVAVVNLTDTLTLDDVFLGALANYVVYRAILKDAEYAGGASLAPQFYQAFMTAVAAQGTSEQGDSPNTTFATLAPQQPVAVPPPQGRK